MDFDVFVIGSGVAGQTVAENCADAGKKVAIADNRIYGGTCANRGCDPKKVLLTYGEMATLLKGFTDRGLSEIPNFNWEEMIEFKNSFTANIPSNTEDKLKSKDIHLFHQSPSFLNKNTVIVEGKQITAKKFVIASGLEPNLLDIAGSSNLYNSDDFLRLNNLPKSAIFLGAGYIAMEFAHLLAAMGSSVSIIQKSNRILSGFDADLSQELVQKSKHLGINFIFGADVNRVEKLSDSYEVRYRLNGNENSIKANIILNTTGRVPAAKKLNLSKAEVSWNKSGVLVDSYLQCKTNKNIYACGDISSIGKPLSPLSAPQGLVVAHNILNEQKIEYKLPSTPSTVFTNPPMSMVGMLEEDAKRRYKNVEIKSGLLTESYHAKRLGESSYSYKIIINSRTNIIVGAHILGPLSSETINIFAMAIEFKITIPQLKKIVFTYPSLSNDIFKMIS